MLIFADRCRHDHTPRRDGRQPQGLPYAAAEKSKGIDAITAVHVASMNDRRCDLQVTTPATPSRPNGDARCRICAMHINVPFSVAVKETTMPGMSGVTVLCTAAGRPHDAPETRHVWGHYRAVIARKANLRNGMVHAHALMTHARPRPVACERQRRSHLRHL